MQDGGGRATGDRAALDRVPADARAVQIREIRGDAHSLPVERDPVAVPALREALLITDYTAMFLETTDRGVPLLEPELAQVRDRLLSGYPDPIDRILRVLIWYGSGTANSSGYPTHEAVPAQLLDQEEPADIARAVKNAAGRAPVGATEHTVTSTAVRTGRTHPRTAP